MTEQPAIGEVPSPDRTRRLVRVTRDAFSRVLAGFLLFAALVVWSRIMGASPFGGASFVAAPNAERILMAVLAGLLPLAALGLWFVVAWGRVLWIAIVALHGFAVLQGWVAGPWTGAILGFHALSLGLFAVIEIAFVLDRRRLPG